MAADGIIRSTLLQAIANISHSSRTHLLRGISSVVLLIYNHSIFCHINLVQNYSPSSINMQVRVLQTVLHFIVLRILGNALNEENHLVFYMHKN